eukprot:SAG31_NODE_5315_length_2613_cov_4.737868_5_plen_34_part_01
MAVHCLHACLAGVCTRARALGRGARARAAAALLN